MVTIVMDGVTAATQLCQCAIVFWQEWFIRAVQGSGRAQPVLRSETLAKYLVTGAAGFIGRSIAAALLARGASVRGIDSFITGKRENLSGLGAMEFIEGDLADPAVCAKACAGVEIVFHEAAWHRFRVPWKIRCPQTFTAQT